MRLLCIESKVFLLDGFDGMNADELLWIVFLLERKERG